MVALRAVKSVLVLIPFSMWQSPTWNGQQGAFRFLVMVMLVMIVVLLPEEDA